MRIFGSESMNNILEKLGLKDGESIDHPWINKALERAQQKVEARNFDIRKTLIKFDNVLNDQRQVIFTQRKNAMNSDQIFDYSNEFLKEIIKDLLQLRSNKLSNLRNDPFENKLKTIMGKNLNENEIKNLISLKNEDLTNEIFRIFKQSRNERSKIIGDDQSKEIEKRIFLQTIDINWKSHIQYLEQLRQVIGLRSYGQRDPLIEYKKEAFDLFSNLLEKLKIDYIKILINLKIIESKEKQDQIKTVKIDPKYVGKKMSRNEPCFCGSGKKYKRCCGAL